MECNLESKLFAIKGYDFQIRDFLDALDFFGILAQWRNKVESSLKAQETGKVKNLFLDEESIAVASEDFRYENDLLNVDELRHWLDSHFLNERDLEEYLIRQYWGDQLTAENKTQSIEAPLFTIYAEIVLSGSFESLIQSWQKRLVSWFEVHEQKYDDFETLEQNFKNYESLLRKDCDLDAWIRYSHKDLQNCQLEIFGNNSEDFNTAELIGQFDGFYKDLPPVAKKYSPYLVVGQLDGPFAGKGNYIWLKLISQKEMQKDCSESMEYAFEEYKSEVWRTLSVKYIDA